MSESSQFEFAPCCKTEPQSPIVDTFASCNRPRQISKEGHLKSISKPWIVELERKTENLKRKIQLTTQQLKVHSQNGSLHP